MSPFEFRKKMRLKNFLEREIDSVIDRSIALKKYGYVQNEFLAEIYSALCSGAAIHQALSLYSLKGE